MHLRNLQSLLIKQVLRTKFLILKECKEMNSQSFKLKKFTAKILLYTEDGRDFLCINQFFIQDLESNHKVNGSPLQGKKFRIIEETDGGDDE